jgi:hypothetical protein
MAACGMSAFRWSTGRYTLEGNQIKIVEQQAKMRSANGCAGSARASDSPLETHVYTLAIQPSDFMGTPELVISENGQAISPPYRQK